jgi:hypothetical protein
MVHFTPSSTPPSCATANPGITNYDAVHKYCSSAIPARVYKDSECECKRARVTLNLHVTWWTLGTSL